MIIRESFKNRVKSGFNFIKLKLEPMEDPVCPDCGEIYVEIPGMRHRCDLKKIIEKVRLELIRENKL